MVLTQEQQHKLGAKPLRDLLYDVATMVAVDITHPGVPIPFYASFYVLMGQYFKNVKVAFGSKEKDLRLNFFHISNSRSGKGEIASVTKQAATGLGLRWTKVTKITDAGLLGSIDQYAIEYNYKNKLNEDDDRWKNPVIVGDLGNFDLIFFDECKQLLEPQTYNENSMQIMQEALDYPGHVRSKLKFSYPIEYDCSCSIYATTYYLGKSIETSLLTTGFFQRMMPFMKDLTIEENEYLRLQVIAKFKTDKASSVLYKDKLDFFVAKIKAIDNSARTLYLDDSAIEELRKAFQLINEEIKKTSGENLKVLMAFSQTLIDICVKIGGIHAAIAGKEFVSGRDISSSLILARAMGNTVINKLGSTVQKSLSSADARRVLNILVGIGSRTTTMNLVAEVCIGLRISKRKAYNLVRRLVNENYLLEELGEGNTKYIVCGEA